MKYIVFNTINTVIHADVLRKEYMYHLTQYMTSRYGGTNQLWGNAYRQLILDWSTYHTDLDFGDENGLSDMRESRFRTTRALFRLAKMPEPSHQGLMQLSQQLHVLVYEKCINADMINLRCLSVIQKWHQTTKIVLATYTFANELQALISNTPLESLVSQIIAPDNIGLFNRDKSYFQRLITQLDAPAQSILYIDHHPNTLDFAQSMNIQSLFFDHNLSENLEDSINTLANT